MSVFHIAAFYSCYFSFVLVLYANNVLITIYYNITILTFYHNNFKK